MRHGFFGKFPGRRDFVARNVSRSTIQVWEAWLQGGVSVSRARLGDRWLNVYLRAPVWHFWLGPRVTGAATIGAFGPAVDGIGRYFPLTVFCSAEEHEDLAPPDAVEQEAWHAGAANLLLDALEPETSLEDLEASLEVLSQVQIVQPTLAPDALRWSHGALVGPLGSKGLVAAVAALRAADLLRTRASSVIFWTHGGEGFPALALSNEGLPSAQIFHALLRGDFRETLT